ncbi:MAG: hypothetical protein HYU66_02335 [Armatimonadetes bacterium]|nr:hypothetical protein [Armatimonadota bacterium]
MAYAVLAYEISLTRIFSVLFRSPYVFLILSIAVCGLGVGAFLAVRREEDEPDLAGPALAFALLLPLPLVLLLTVGKGLVAGARGTAVALLTALPYVAAGVLLARAFRRHAGDAGRLYFCDLTGAGLAALTTAALLARVGGLAMPLWLGTLAALAAWLVCRPRGAAWQAASVAVLLVCAGLFGLQQRRPFLDLPPVTVPDEDEDRAVWTKPLFRELADPRAGSTMQYTQWSAVARTDVVSNTGTDVLYIWTDGDVPTQMEPFQGDLGSPRMALYRNFIGMVPYALQPAPERVLCIGPGGGLDVLLALLGGARQIEPVEINPAIVDVTERFKGFYGDLYHRPEVAGGLVIDEGRSYLSRARQPYDVIYFALAKSATSQQGGLALVDGYLYTKEAFHAYFDHLRPGGLVALVFDRWHLVDRCLTTATAALLERGLTGDQVADQVVLLTLPEGRVQGPYQHLLLLRNGPFGPALRTRLKDVGQRCGLQPVFVPKLREPPPYNVLRQPGVTADALATAIAGQEEYLQRLVKGGPFVRLNLGVLTDDRPFYADLSPGLHPFLKALLKWSLGAGLLTLAIAVAAVGRRPGRAGACSVGYFAGLGMGFLLVEVALVQKLVLLLGYPTLALSVILFALLVGSALGSRFSARGTLADTVRRLPVVMGLLVLALLAARFALQPLTTTFLPMALPARIAVTVAVVGGLGFLMGQPFPSGLRALEGARRLVPIAWAVNGVLSVTGSVLAASAASLWGYSVVLVAGAGIYLVTLLLALGWMPSRTKQEPAGAAAN